MKKFFKSKDFILSVVFVLLGVVTRTILHLGPNVEFITAISLASGYFLKNKKISLVVTLSIMYITDVIIGNSVIFLFTWSGFAIVPILGMFLARLKINGKLKEILTCASSIPTAVVSTLVFFLWTNFGVVLTTDMYTKNLAGLFTSYRNALPFLTNQLVANLIIVPSLFGVIFFVEKLVKIKENKLDTSFQNKTI